MKTSLVSPEAFLRADRCFDFVKNHVTPGSRCAGKLFADSGPDKAFITHQGRLSHLWTLVERSGVLLLSPGFEVDGRIGFFVSTKPWNDDQLPVQIG